MSYISTPSSGISSVSTDATLTGDGTSGSELSVVQNYATAAQGALADTAVQPTLTANLDFDGNDLVNGDTLEANVLNSTVQATGLKILPSAGGHKLGFFGTTPVVQEALISIPPPTPMPPTYDNLLLDGEFAAINLALDQINDILKAYGLEASV